MIMLLSSSLRPEPKSHPEPENEMMRQTWHDDKELRGYIENDRREGMTKFTVEPRRNKTPKNGGFIGIIKKISYLVRGE